MPPRTRKTTIPADLCAECFPDPDSYPGDATSVGCPHGTWTLTAATVPVADAE